MRLEKYMDRWMTGKIESKFGVLLMTVALVLHLFLELAHVRGIFTANVHLRVR